VESEILTAHEVAAYLRMNPMSIYRLAQEGRIPASKVLDCWRFRRSEIDRWLLAKGTGQRVLIVDGDRDFINMTSACLKVSGIRYQMVFEGWSALKYLEQEIFSLVFVGMKMQDISGIQLLSQIEENYPEIPLVLLAEPEERSEIPKLERGYVIVDKFQNEQEWRNFLRLTRRI
jgi:excisionase family DNA binding protein